MMTLAAQAYARPTRPTVPGAPGRARKPSTRRTSRPSYSCGGHRRATNERSLEMAPKRSRERNPAVRARSAAAGRLRWTEAAHTYREAVRGAGARRRRRMAARPRLERRRATRRFRRRRPARACRASGRRGDGPVARYYDMAGLSATLRGAGAPWAAAAARRGLRPRTTGGPPRPDAPPSRSCWRLPGLRGSHGGSTAVLRRPGALEGDASCHKEALAQAQLH